MLLHHLQYNILKDSSSILERSNDSEIEDWTDARIKVQYKLYLTDKVSCLIGALDECKYNRPKMANSSRARAVIQMEVLIEGSLVGSRNIECHYHHTQLPSHNLTSALITISRCHLRQTAPHPRCKLTSVTGDPHTARTPYFSLSSVFMGTQEIFQFSRIFGRFTFFS